MKEFYDLCKNNEEYIHTMELINNELHFHDHFNVHTQPNLERFWAILVYKILVYVKTTSIGSFKLRLILYKLNTLAVC